MSTRVGWLFTVAIKDGQKETFEGVMNDMVQAVNSGEPGTVGYDWFIGDDDSTVHIHEWFEDSAAAAAHLGNFGAFAERFMGAADPTGITCYGPASDELRGILDDLGASYMGRWGGFVR